MKISLIGFSRRGCDLAKEVAKVAEILNGHECKVYSKTSAEVTGTIKVEGPTSKWTEEAFKDSDAIVYVGATGIAVRYIAPYIRNKTVDPAIICMDERGQFVISLLAGHIGGANGLAKEIAEGIGATPVITTATDVNGKFSVDTYATKKNMHIGSMSIAKDISSILVDDKRVGLSTDLQINGDIPPELDLNGDEDVGIFISYSNKKGPFKSNLKLTPRCHVLGIGCRRGTPMERIEQLVNDVLSENDISMKSIRAIASIDLKSDEEGLLEFSRSIGIEPVFFTSDELNALPDMGFTPSQMVRSVTGVDNVCERSAVAASNKGDIVIKKTAKDGVTVAVVREPMIIDLSEE